jgi:hypothetical protein
MLNLIKSKSRSILWVLVLLAGCDSELATIQSADTSRIDEVRSTKSEILDARKTRCDDLLLTLETSEMSQKMWDSLQCSAFYSELAERENPDVTVKLAVPIEPVLTGVQSGEIDFGGAMQNISKVVNDNPAPDGEESLDSDPGGEN